MKAFRPCAAVWCLFAVGSVAYGQTPPGGTPGMQMPGIRADIKMSATAQLAYAQSLLADVQNAPPRSPARVMAVAKALTALEAIPMKWPEESDSVAQGAFMEANLFAGQHAYENVVQVIDRVFSKSNGGARAPELWLARADAASALHHTADAEESYERAEASARKSKDDDKLAVILQRKAAFHIESGAHAAASKELHEAAKLTKKTITRIGCLSAAYRSDLTLDPHSAVRDLDDIDQALQDAEKEDNGAGGDREYIKHTHQWVNSERAHQRH
jgi:tetratricopeptide (TPR) repeat protein